MKICPKCNAQLDDNAAFCTNCGVPFAPVAPVAPAYDPYDHTAEFDAKDVSDNKVIAMLVYLMGPIGIIIALLAANTSAYAAFHLRQALKFTVVEILAPIALIIATIINIIPFIGWIAYVLLALGYIVLSCALFVIKIICFFQICKGQAKEAAIIRSLKFLK
ncbi:MAG: zinc-ribbon domain-containing protein [Clostridia bacterium]|nr:zinc-ribbon domain-containing protein [Clostridia bacterium]